MNPKENSKPGKSNSLSLSEPVVVQGLPVWHPVLLHTHILLSCLNENEGGHSAAQCCNVFLRTKPSWQTQAQTAQRHSQDICPLCKCSFLLLSSLRIPLLDRVWGKWSMFVAEPYGSSFTHGFLGTSDLNTAGCSLLWCHRAWAFH